VSFQKAGKEENDILGEVYFALCEGSGFIRERNRPSIIRYSPFNVNIDRQNYFRALVMLHSPWTDEQADLIQRNCEEFYQGNEAAIKANFDRLDSIESLEDAFRRAMEVEDNNEENIDEEAEVYEEFRALAFPEMSLQINVLNLNNHVQEIDPDSNIRVIKLPPIISAEHSATLVRTLNLKQKTFLTHVLQNARNASFYEFVGDGAGVGKSRLISTLFQYNGRAGCDPTSIKILLCAPTDKAAFGIGGSTLHSMFSFPVNQTGSAFRSLSPDLLNTLRSRFIDLKVLLIDEMSMVGATMFSHLNSRLKQIFSNVDAPFEGISVIVFGDLRQFSAAVA